MNEATALFDVNEIDEKLVEEVLNEVSFILKERGYNPINQIVGYIISGDPGYISSFKDARSKMLTLDRTMLVEVLLKNYIGKI